MNEDALIQKYIEPDPYHRGPAGARLRTGGVHVWAIIGDYLYEADQDVQRVAADYDVPVEAVRAAVVFYHRHKADIDAKLASNAAPIS